MFCKSVPTLCLENTVVPQGVLLGPILFLLDSFYLKFGRRTSTSPLLSVVFADTTGSLYKQQTPRMSDWFKREYISSKIVLMLKWQT